MSQYCVLFAGRRTCLLPTIAPSNEQKERKRVSYECLHLDNVAKIINWNYFQVFLFLRLLCAQVWLEKFYNGNKNFYNFFVFFFPFSKSVPHLYAQYPPSGRQCLPLCGKRYARVIKRSSRIWLSCFFIRGDRVRESLCQVQGCQMFWISAC